MRQAKKILNRGGHSPFERRRPERTEILPPPPAVEMPSLSDDGSKGMEEEGEEEGGDDAYGFPDHSEALRPTLDCAKKNDNSS